MNTDVSLSINKDLTFTIRWATNLAADEFIIEMNGSEIGTVRRPSTSFTTTATAQLDNTYIFTVKAVNSIGAATSKPVSVAYARPNPPTNLNVSVDAAAGGLELTWVAPTGGTSSYDVIIVQTGTATEMLLQENRQ